MARKKPAGQNNRRFGSSLPSENKIYISENLTATNRGLFKDCLKVKKDLITYSSGHKMAGFFFAKILEVLLLWFQIDLDQVCQSTGEMTVTTCDAATGS